MKSIFVLPAIFLAGAVLTAQEASAGGNNNTNSHDNNCDLVAKFVEPTKSKLPGGESVKWKVKFTNKGSGKCAKNSIQLSRYSGKHTSGQSRRIEGSSGAKQLKKLLVGQSQTLKWKEGTPPKKGFYTYKVKYSSDVNDVNNHNHHPVKTVKFKNNGGHANTSHQNCDLVAALDLPGDDSSYRISGHREEWKVTFRNVGTDPCPGNSVRLNYNNSYPASFNNRTVQNSGGAKKLPELNPGGVHVINWTRARAPMLDEVSVVYGIKYSSHFNDLDNSNHQPTETIFYFIDQTN